MIYPVKSFLLYFYIMIYKWYRDDTEKEMDYIVRKLTTLRNETTWNSRIHLINFFIIIFDGVLYWYEELSLVNYKKKFSLQMKAIFSRWYWFLFLLKNSDIYFEFQSNYIKLNEETYCIHYYTLVTYMSTVLSWNTVSKHIRHAITNHTICPKPLYVATHYLKMDIQLYLTCLGKPQKTVFF